jgi:hypothetical protein
MSLFLGRRLNVSEEVLRIRYPIGAIERGPYRPKGKAQDIEVQETLGVLSEVELSSAYLDFIFMKTGRRIDGKTKTHKGTSTDNGWAWIAATVLVAGIIVIGLVVGYLNPGPVTGAVLPIGLVLWWLLYRIADHIDQHR